MTPQNRPNDTDEVIPLAEQHDEPEGKPKNRLARRFFETARNILRSRSRVREHAKAALGGRKGSEQPSALETTYPDVLGLKDISAIEEIYNMNLLSDEALEVFADGDPSLLLQEIKQGRYLNHFNEGGIREQLERELRPDEPNYRGLGRRDIGTGKLMSFFTYYAPYSERGELGVKASDGVGYGRKILDHLNSISPIGDNDAEIQQLIRNTKRVILVDTVGVREPGKGLGTVAMYDVADELNDLPELPDQEDYVAMSFRFQTIKHVNGEDSPRISDANTENSASGKLFSKWRKIGTHDDHEGDAEKKYLERAGHRFNVTWVDEIRTRENLLQDSRRAVEKLLDRKK